MIVPWRVPSRPGVLLWAVLAACAGETPAGGDEGTTAGGDEGTTAAATAGSSGPAGSTGDGTGAPAESIRDARYCEILLVRTTEQSELEIDVYNSLGFSGCPSEAFDMLDVGALPDEHGVTAALLNGPRHFVMDEIDAEFSFHAGRPVYELTDAEGRVYVMQSYSLEVDPGLSLAGLAELGERLALPEGWSFAERILDAPLTVATSDGRARVIQDDWRNTYQLRE